MQYILAEGNELPGTLDEHNSFMKTIHEKINFPKLMTIMSSLSEKVTLEVCPLQCQVL